jgi:hypothetical protein
MPQTLNTILKYLEELKKVDLNKDGSIVWFFQIPLKLKRY